MSCSVNKIQVNGAGLSLKTHHLHNPTPKKIKGNVLIHMTTGNMAIGEFPRMLNYPFKVGGSYFPPSKTRQEESHLYKS